MSLLARGIKRILTEVTKVRRYIRDGNDRYMMHVRRHSNRHLNDTSVTGKKFGAAPMETFQRARDPMGPVNLN